MKRAAAVLLLVTLVLACAEEKPKPLSEPGEKLSTVRGTIVNRAGDSLRIQHEKIEGFMAAMTMEFPVRGARVDDLPPNGSRIEAQLHVTSRSYWITDVKPIP